MLNREATILLVSNDELLCKQARRELSEMRDSVRVSSVASLDAAWRAVEDAAPDVIVLQEKTSGSNGNVRLQSMVESLAGYAPVVVIGPPERRAEISALLNAGAADYVEQSEGLSAALGRVAQRLNAAGGLRAASPAILARVADDFGEVLRHELNNPLTGILGNAELLLADIRRRDDGRLPQGGQQRVEAIAALAVRLRESVRRLSQEWESQHGHSAAHSLG